MFILFVMILFCLFCLICLLFLFCQVIIETNLVKKHQRVCQKVK